MMGLSPHATVKNLGVNYDDEWDSGMSVLIKLARQIGIKVEKGEPFIKYLIDSI